MWHNRSIEVQVRNKNKPNIMAQVIKFPHWFLWGAATSAHQVEGNNVHSDWWAWEHSARREQALVAAGKNPEDFQSGAACDSYNRYEEDFSLAEHLGHTAHRLSIEWARIEPQEGVFDERELDHYEKVLQAARFHNLKIFATLHHFTNPLWFANKGGFEKTQNVEFFVRYAKLVAQRLGEYVDFWITINEPEGYAAGSYLAGVWPPQKKSLWSAFRVAHNLCLAHNAAAPQIKLISGKPVSMAWDIVDLQPTGHISRVIARLFYDNFNKFVFHRTVDSSDFIGVNYYFHHHLGIFGKRKHSASHHSVSDIGWGIHPEGLERVLLHLKRYQKPIYITENGIADARDSLREKFIKDHLYYTHRAMEKGADVRGYLHWSLMDNFEWEKGFAPKFGLIEIDRQDRLRRKVRYSATKYAEICKSGYLEV